MRAVASAIGTARRRPSVRSITLARSNLATASATSKSTFTVSRADKSCSIRWSNCSAVHPPSPACRHKK